MPLGPKSFPPCSPGVVAAMSAGRPAVATVPMMPTRDRKVISPRARTAWVRPISGRTSSKLVGATPGWERFAVMPHPFVLLRRSSSSPKRPKAILEWEYAPMLS